MYRLFASLAVAVLLLPGAANAAPVSPTPIPSTTFDGAVTSAAYVGDVIYVGGDFTHATVNGVRHRRTRLAALDARNGALLNWTPTADAIVTSVAADTGGVYIVGDFRYVNGTKRDSLAKLNPVTGKLRSSLSHRISGHPNTVALGHGRVYIGGSLTSVDGIARIGLAAFDADTGALDQVWAPVVNDIVMAIRPVPDRVYLAGRFDSVNGALNTQKVAAVRADTGAPDPAFISPVIALTHELTVANGVLYAAIDGNGGKAMAMDARTGTPKWTVAVDGDVTGIAVLNDTVYLGGHFDNFCKSLALGEFGRCLDGQDHRVKLAAVDLNGKLLPWTANGNGSVGVHTVVSSPAHGQLLAAGEFTQINSVSQRRFALFNLVP